MKSILRVPLHLLLLIVVAVAAQPACGWQVINPLLTKAQASRGGLDVEWTGHIAVDSARNHVSSLDQQIGPYKSWTAYEVKVDQNIQTFSERDKDRFGNLLGAAGAKQKAEKYMNSMLTLGYEATIEQKSYPIAPEIYVYALTSTSMVHCLNGETGETLWTVQVGDRLSPSWMKSDNGYVAVANGTDLYCLDGYTGEILWKRKCRGAPSGTPAISTEFIFVPMADGVVEDYFLGNSRRVPESVRAPGNIYVGALATPFTVSWISDRGQMNIANGNFESAGRTVSYRVKFGSKSVAAPTALEVLDEGSKMPRYLLLAGSVGGEVYCIDERNGGIVWVFAAGQPVRETPFAIGQDVFVVTDGQLLFAVDASTGLEVWRKSGYRRVISASSKNVYVLDSLGKLAVIDRSTGSQIALLPTTNASLFMDNIKTDRVFVGTKSGAIQCLREQAQKQPLFHRLVSKEVMPAQQDDRRGKPETEKPTMPAKDPDDPFGAGAVDDPFAVPGGGAKKDDPFGAGAMDDKKDDDDNPFN
jgi:outer membrane protein assembly factor BamB